MAFPFLALQLAIDLAFVALAARTIASWVAAPDPRHGTLAIALSALAVMMLLAPVLGRSGPAGQVITDVAAAVFLISGYGLLAFRNTFVPFRPTTMRVLIVILVGTLAGTFSAGFQVAIEVIALLIVPVLYVAFFPPTWVRRIWRRPEEEQFRHALHDLLMYSPDRGTLAERALMWAERLIGGDASYVVDAGGSILASRGVSREEASRMSEQAGILSSARATGGQAPWRSGTTLVVPLDLKQGKGAMAIVTGRLSPLFGDD